MADSEQIARKRSIREKQLIKTKSRNVVGMVEIIAEDAREVKDFILSSQKKGFVHF